MTVPTDSPSRARLMVSSPSMLSTIMGMLLSWHSAVAVVSSERLHDVTSSSIGDMLQGKVAGLSVVKGSGMPGNTPAIRLRGVSSMNAPQEPLYVVDGIIGGTYDPNDVETITVLKDAGSTGMYGAQANGGVIIITTKHAKTDETVFNVKASFGVTTPDFTRNKNMNSKQLYNYYREYFRDPTTYMIDDVAFNNAIPSSVLDTDTDWRGLVYDPGYIQNYHVSMMGRNGKHSFYNSISLYYEDGTLDLTDYGRVNIRSNNSWNVSNWLDIKNDINLMVYRRSDIDTNIMYYVWEALPWDSPYDSEGNTRTFADADDIWMRDAINPLLAFENDNFSNKTWGFETTYDLVFEARIFPWLSASTQNRAYVSTYKTHYHRTEDMEYMSGGDAIEEINGMSIGYISTNLLKASKDFGLHTISGLVGYESQMSYDETLSSYGEGLPEGLYVLDVASSNPIIGGTNTKSVMQSFISQANYNFKERYFITASFRIDQSFTFNKDNRTACFPSVSGAWMLSEEPWMENAIAISNLKIKASWGITGMKDIGASKYLESFAYTSSYFNNTSAVPTQMANPDLKWEQTYQHNLGVELGLWKNRLTLDVNAYYNDTDNLLVYRELPPSGGFTAQWQNFGNDVNTGFELAIAATPIKTKDWQWDVNFQISYNKNWLYGFGDTQIFTSTLEGIQQIYEDGESLYTWYLKEYAGIDPQTGRQQYVDENGELTYDYASARYINAGSALAPWQGGVSTSVSWKNWILSATGTFVWGNTLYGNGHASTLSTFVDNSLVPSSKESIWTQPGDEATIGLAYYATANLYHTGYLVAGDYFKIRNITLQYTLPKKIMRNKTLTLSLSCDNPFTFTNVWGGDPEASIGSDNTLPGRINDLQTRYPNSRQYVFTVNFTL